MAATYATLFWCALQVSLFLLLATPVYLIVRRRNPAAGTAVAASALAAVVMLSCLAVSPWPRWSLAWATPGSEVTELAAESSDSSAQPAANVVGDHAGAMAANADHVVANDSLLTTLWRAAQYDGNVAPAAVAPGTEAETPQRPAWPTWIVWAIVAGVALGAGHLLVSLAAVRRLIGRSEPPNDSLLQNELNELRRQLNLSRPIALYVSAEIGTPATVGMFRPAIVLPVSWIGWDAVERRAVLAHELAHIAGRDFAAWLVARGAVVLHFYHPLVRWFVGRLQLDQELAADATAARLLGDRQAYLQALASLALATPHERLAGSLRTFIPTRSLLVRRVEMLRRNESRLASSQARGTLRWGVLLTAIATTIAVAGLRPELQAEERASATASTEETRSIQISGSVVDAQGAPVRDALVVCPLYDLERKAAVTRTLPDGTFALKASASTDRRMLFRSLWAYAQGHGVRSVNLRALWKEPTTDLTGVVLTLPAVEESGFVVLDPDGKPLVGASVGPRDMAMPNGVYSADEPTGLSGPIPDEIVQLIQRTTEDEGRASFDAVPAAVLQTVRVETPEFGCQVFHRPQRELRLKRVGRVDGSIIAANPVRLEGMHIQLSSESGEGGRGEASVVVDKEGKFSVPAMAAGRLNVRLAWPDQLNTQPEMAVRNPLLQAGESLSVEIQERPAVILRGRIVAGAERIPVQRAEVFVRHVQSPNFGQHVETDAKGEFEAKTFSGETYVQVISLGDNKAIAKSYDFPRLPNESIPAGTDDFQLDDIVLQPKATIAGILLRSDGSPSVNANIGLRRGDAFRHLAGVTKTDAKGEFRMPVSDWKLSRGVSPETANEWLLISQPESPQETPSRTPLKVLSEEPLVLQEQ